MEDNTMITAKFQTDFKRQLSNLLFTYFYPNVPDEDSRDLIAMASLSLLLKMLKERANELHGLGIVPRQDSLSESFKNRAMEKSQNNLTNMNTNK